MKGQSLKTAADELRERARRVTSDRTRRELLVLAEQYEQLSQIREPRQTSYMRLPSSLFN